MTATLRLVRSGRTYSFEVGGQFLSFAEALERLRADDRFVVQLTETLQASPHEAFFWECAPVSRETVNRSFEFALTPSDELARVEANPKPFAAQLGACSGPICTFENLSGDAELVVPAKQAARAAYAHLANFVRKAPTSQVSALWRAVGDAAVRELETRSTPLWLNTSGLGVHWLHVRLDSWPKYYSYEPFRQMA